MTIKFITDTEGVRSQEKSKARPSIFEFDDLLGDRSEGVTPVPIPNTAVKPLSPDGTARASVWESRKLPD